jgi:hypothetical protein
MLLFPARVRRHLSDEWLGEPKGPLGMILYRIVLTDVGNTTAALHPEESHFKTLNFFRNANLIFGQNKLNILQIIS